MSDEPQMRDTLTYVSISAVTRALAV